MPGCAAPPEGTPPRRLVPPPAPVGVHGERIAAHFGGLGGEGLAVDPALRVLLLCFVNRSGSFHLADLLAATGRLRLAEEVFNGDVVVADPASRQVRDFPAYLGHLLRTRSGGGWFAAKASPEQLSLLAEAGLFDALGSLPRFVLMSRRDRVAQAVSRALAEQTGRWASFMPGRAGATAVYDRARIAQALADIEGATGQLEAFFAANAIEPIRVVYEELLARPQQEVDRVLAALGLPPAPIDASRLRWRSQHGALNIEWRQRFLSGE